jgi:ABC-type nitrate/sulfonate/bicarbonate transport system permease component
MIQLPTMIIRWIVLAVLLAGAVILGFGLDTFELPHTPFLRALRFLSRLLLLSAPLGAVAGVIFGNLILRNARLTTDIIHLLRIVQWAPFLIVWTLAFALTGWEQQVSWAWLASYCGVAVGLRVTYEYLLVRHFEDIDEMGAIKQIVRPAIEQGLFMALLLDMSILAEFWSPWGGGGTGGIGYSISIVLAIVIPLVSWVAGETFHSTSVNSGRLLVNVFQTEKFAYLVGPALITLFFPLLWFVAAHFVSSISPATVFASFSSWLTEEFYRDVSVSFGELGAGMLISGSLAAGIVFLREQFSSADNISDPLIRACQLAPIAALPSVQYSYGVSLSRWSVLCVVTFTFYPFLRALTGFNEVRAVSRLALATSEALPYGCAAFIFGEMWNATAGIGFMMTVAAATYQIDKGMAGFVVLVSLFGMTHIILHCIAKKMWTKTMQPDP